MTLIVAVGCSDGVVIGADSASSDSEAGTKQEVEKVKTISNLAILYGGSGDGGLHQKIDEALADLKPHSSIKRIRQEIRKLVAPELEESRKYHVPYPAQGFNVPPASILLFAGVLNSQPWIVEIEKDGRDTSYTKEMGWFAAIGSGKPAAQAVFRPHLYTERDLNLGRVFAYRVLEDSIALAAAYLSKPIHLYTIALDGKISKMTADEEKDLARTCQLWRSLEREAVGKLLAPKAEVESEPQIPTPQEDGSES